MTTSSPSNPSLLKQIVSLATAMQAGAGQDLESLPPTGATAADVNFDDLAIGRVPGVIGQPNYFIVALQGLVRIAKATHAETSGHVLTSDSPTGNDVAFVFLTHRNTLDLTVEPDPASGEEALIEFLDRGSFETLHSVRIDPAGGPRHLSYTEHDPGKNIQGLRWTGGRLTLDHVTLHSV